MFYAIYENGGPFRESDSRKVIFSLLGEYKVYSAIGGKIRFLPDIKTSTPLVINNFEITKFNRHIIRSEIEIYDRVSSKYFDLITRGGDFQTVLLSLTKDLSFSRNFPSFETYLQYEELNRKVKKLEKENEKLKVKIREMSKKKS